MSPITSPRAHNPPYPSPFPPRPGVDPTVPQVHVTPPMVYIEATYEYKELTRELATEAPPSEAELNELGKAGWELVSVLNDGRSARWYFKRLGR